MSGMFSNALSFNGNIGSWNTSGVTDMRWMFLGTELFNQDIGDWNTASVSQMDYMFYNALAFNQDLSRWCVDPVPSHTDFDTDAASWTNDPDWRPDWGNCPQEK